MRKSLFIAFAFLFLTLPGVAWEPDDPYEGVGGGGSDCWQCAEGIAYFPGGGSQAYSFCLGLPSSTQGYDDCWAGSEGQGCFLLSPCSWN